VLTNAGETSNGVPFTVRAGRIFFVAPDANGSGSFGRPLSPADIHDNIRPGDTYYFRAGTYAGQYGDTMWQKHNFTLGPAQRGKPGRPLALVGYPGETATLTSQRTNIGFNTGAGVGA